ncbi:hypothetical protein K438DRAFT_1993233 [Mycena galopus ATCC 62051]|nr:hypothetical protein K438DRAFT_1993233 [Mycena galopus ATCC 62051]
MSPEPTAIVVTTKTPLEGRKPHCGALGRLTVLLLWITIVANPANTPTLLRKNIQVTTFSLTFLLSISPPLLLGSPAPLAVLLVSRSRRTLPQNRKLARICALPVRGAAHALSSPLPPQKVSLLRCQLFRQCRKNLAPGPGPEEKRRGPIPIPSPSPTAKDFTARSCHADAARSRRIYSRTHRGFTPLALARWFFSTMSLAPQSLSFCLVHGTQQSWHRAAGSLGRKSSVLFSRNVRSHSEELPPPFLPPTLEFPPQKNSFTAMLHPRRKNLAVAFHSL